MSHFKISTRKINFYLNKLLKDIYNMMELCLRNEAKISIKNYVEITKNQQSEPLIFETISYIKYNFFYYTPYELANTTLQSAWKL